VEFSVGLIEGAVVGINHYSLSYDEEDNEYLHHTLQLFLLFGVIEIMWTSEFT
jgi:hypothetical protein